MEARKAVTTAKEIIITKVEATAHSRLKVPVAVDRSRGHRPLPRNRRGATILSVVKKRRKKRPLSKDKEEVVASRPAKIRVKINSPKIQDPKPLNKLHRKKPRLLPPSRTIAAGVQRCSRLS